MIRKTGSEEVDYILIGIAIGIMIGIFIGLTITEIQAINEYRI